MRVGPSGLRELNGAPLGVASVDSTPTSPEIRSTVNDADWIRRATRLAVRAGIDQPPMPPGGVTLRIRSSPTGKVSGSEYHTYGDSHSL